MGNRGVLAIIPARGGSKGIPRKNVRFLAGKPLIAYSIENALGAKLVDRVVVSTDDEEIAHIAKITGAEVIMRPDEFARDEVPLDPVINHAVETIEATDNQSYQAVVTLQPTSPLLSPQTIDRVIKKFLDGETDTLLTVEDDRHLAWTKLEGEYTPLYEKRVNRQFLPAAFKETGGILVTKRECVSPQTRFGKKIDLFELDKTESIDIDGYMDWWIAEKLLNRKRILLRVDGNNEIGLGHIYRTLLLAGRLIDHNVLFASRKDHPLGAELIRKNFYPIEVFESEAGLNEIINRFKPDIIINDILDTEPGYVNSLKEKGLFVVNFEDMGDGSRAAHTVINALYEERYPYPNFNWGQRYYCLREEFLLLEPRAISDSVKEVLITFGGTDSNDYTSRILKIISELSIDDLKVKIITGLGYEHFDRLTEFSKSLDTDIEIIRNTRTISKHMHQADMVFTSAGRTVFEVSSLGTPVIVMAQNERELKHTFAKAENGIFNLGLGTEVTDDEIRAAFVALKDDVALRKRCNELMLGNDLKAGIQNVLELIFSKYDDFKNEIPK